MWETNVPMLDTNMTLRRRLNEIRLDVLSSRGVRPDLKYHVSYVWGVLDFPSTRTLEEKGESPTYVVVDVFS